MDGKTPAQDPSEPPAGLRRAGGAAPSVEARSEPMPAGKGRGWSLVDWSIFTSPPELLASFVYFAAILAALFLAATTINLVLRAFAPVWTGQEINAEQVRNLLIAIGAVVAAPFAIWRIVISHWQARATQAQARIGQEQARIAQENLYTGMLTKAVEQLGAMREVKETREVKQPDGSLKYETITKTVPNTEVRLGAIYALERIAQDSERDHWPIMETLCAYVRNNAKPMDPLPAEVVDLLAWPNLPTKKSQFLDSERNNRTTSPDVQAALNVIGRRSASQRAVEQRLAKTATTDTALRLDLSACNLQGARLSGGNFSRAIFTRSDLTFALATQTDFQECDVSSAILHGAVLEESNFLRIFGPEADFTGAFMPLATLRDSYLVRARLSGCFMIGAKLDGAEMSDAQLTNATLDHASIVGVKLSRAQLGSASLMDADLRYANLDHASLDLTDIQYTNLEHAFALSGDWATVVNASQGQLNEMCGSAETHFPAYLKPAPTWAAANLDQQEIIALTDAWACRRDEFMAAFRLAADSSPDA